MNLHGSIMNLEAKPPSGLDKATGLVEAYKMGHSDARHAAAELANDTDAVIADARKIIVDLCQCYGHPLPAAILARM